MAGSKCKGGVLAMQLSYLDTDSQLYVVIDPMLSSIDTHDAKIIGIFNNKNTHSYSKNLINENTELNAL